MRSASVARERGRGVRDSAEHGLAGCDVYVFHEVSFDSRVTGARAVTTGLNMVMVVMMAMVMAMAMAS